MYIEKNDKTYISIFFLFLEIFLLFVAVISNSLDCCTYISLVETVVAIIIVASYGYGIISIPVFFLILFYIFNCSQFLLYTMGIEYEVAFDIVKMFEIDDSIFILNLYSASVLFYAFGCLLISRRSKQYNLSDAIDDNKCKKIGKMLIALCIIPRVAVDVNNLLTYRTGGYEATFTGEIGLVLVWAYGFYIGMLLYIVGNRKLPVESLLTCLFFALYLFISMLSGRRIEQTGVLVVLVFVYMKYCKKKQIKTKTLILLFIIAYLLFGFLATIGDLRHSFNVDSDMFMKLFLDNIKGEMISGQLAEFGDSAAPLGYAIRSFPKYHSFNFGRTFLFAWTSVIPNVGGLIKKFFAADIAFTGAIPSMYASNYGCSCLGEFYFNFGIFAPVAMIMVGYFAGKISRYIEKTRTHLLDKRTMIYLAILPTFMTYVRGSFSDFARIIVYYGILISIFLRGNKSN